MSLTGSPSSQQAAAFRIIGATTSRPRSSACTGPTVVASSPVPSQALEMTPVRTQDRKSTRLNSSHGYISYAVFCLKKKTPPEHRHQRRSANSITNAGLLDSTAGRIEEDRR